MSLIDIQGSIDELVIGRTVEVLFKKLNDPQPSKTDLKLTFVRAVDPNNFKACIIVQDQTTCYNEFFFIEDYHIYLNEGDPIIFGEKKFLLEFLKHMRENPIGITIRT